MPPYRRDANLDLFRKKRFEDPGHGSIRRDAI